MLSTHWASITTCGEARISSGSGVSPSFSATLRGVNTAGSGRTLWRSEPSRERSPGRTRYGPEGSGAIVNEPSAPVTAVRLIASATASPLEDLAGLLVPFALGVDEDPGDRLALHVQHAALERDTRLEREPAEVAPLSLGNAVQLAREVVG